MITHKNVYGICLVVSTLAVLTAGILDSGSLCLVSVILLILFGIAFSNTREDATND